MEGHYQHIHQHRHHQYHQQYHQQQQHQQMSGRAGSTVGVDAGDRFPQWSIQETKEFLMIRGDLDRNFMETKRNKLLWEVISTKMREKGFNRSAEQCKCKWKNLVTRYKGCETMEPEGMRQQFPFYNEMQAIFTGRMLWVAEEEVGSGTTSSKKNKTPGQMMSSDEDEDEDYSEGDYKGDIQKKKKPKKTKTNNNTNNNSINALKEMLEDYMKQQLQMEVQWREEYEAREEERRQAEIEWRQRMEALENERLVMERRWREIEEQRKIREEVRAEKRDALINALLNKFTREESSNI